MAESLLGPRLDVLLARTPRANDIVRREPREIPRRLRGLVLAIDGNQTARTYIERLDGFGDVESLLMELISLGLIEFQYRRRGPQATDDDLVMRDAGRSGAFTTSELSPLNALMSDPAEMRRTLADGTMPGSFDDMLRTMRADRLTANTRPQALDLPAARDTVDRDAVMRQVDSLFGMLEAVRADRKSLRERVVSMRKYRERAQALERHNLRLQRVVRGLLVLSGLLALGALALAAAVLRR